MDFILTKIQHALFASVFALFAASQAHAAPAKATRAVGHTSNNHTVVRAEKLHPSANLSYQVKGQRYYPQKVADNFSQTGRASWYGAAFHGKRTSSGEVFDMHALTAAHKTLPIPSYVRVTNLNNGKSVVVRINDRGPFHGSRVMDLSKGAASKLGFVSQGSANVKIEALTAGDSLSYAVATRSKAEAETLATKANDADNIYVSVRTFENESDAKDFLQQASNHLTNMKAEQHASIIKRSEGYVVRIGPFKKQEHADKTYANLTQEVI